MEILTRRIHEKDAEACGRWVLWALQRKGKRFTEIDPDTIFFVSRWAFRWATLALKQDLL